MLSNEIETVFEDGQWLTKTQAAVHFEVSERTIENRIKQGLYPSKAEEGKTLVFVKRSKTDRKMIENQTKEYEAPAKINEEASKEIERLAKENETLRQKIEDLSKELSEARERAAKLEGELSSMNRVIDAKDETIQAKDQAINSANAAVMLMERQTPSVEVTPPERQLEAKRGGWMFWKK